MSEDKYDLHIDLTRTDTFDRLSNDELNKFDLSTTAHIKKLKKRKIELLFKLNDVIAQVDIIAQKGSTLLSKLPIESLYELCESEYDAMSNQDSVKTKLIKDRESMFDEYDALCRDIKIAECSLLQCKSEIIMRSI